MAAQFQRIILQGNLGEDPKVHTTPKSKVAKFVIGVKDWKAGDETEWFRCEAWGKQAEYVEKYLKKGASVFVDCHKRTSKWVDGDQKTRYSEAFVVVSISNNSPRPAHDGSAPPADHDDGEFPKMPEF